MESEDKSGVVSLLPAQRRQRIVAFLRRHGAVTLAQLEHALDASISTLRRDPDALAADGVVDRTHGGALLRQQGYTTFEPDTRAALARNIALTAVTNDLAIAQLLGASPLVQVRVFGGVLRPGSATLTGEAASSKRLLIDASKFRPRSFMQVVSVAAFDEVITDAGAPADEVERLRALGLKVTLAQVGP